MSRPLIAALAAAALFAVVLPAHADAKVITGRTDQGKVVRLVTSGGFMSHMSFAWRAQCDQGPAFSSSTLFHPRDWEVSRYGVAIDDAYVIKGTHGYRARVASRLRMVRPGDGWRGTFSLTTKVTHDGKLLATCSHDVTFTAGKPTPPGAVKYFIGLTQQRRVVALVTDASGAVKDFTIAWEGRCQRHEVYTNNTLWRAPFDADSPAAFNDAGSYVNHYKDQRYKVTQALAGTHAVAPAGEQWSGTLSGKVVGTAHGKTINRCTLSPVSWTATLS